MAAVLLACLRSPVQRASEEKVPMALWEKYGLVTPGWFRPNRGDPRYAKLQRACRFRLALEEGEGLFPIFGRFLAGRADLLPSPYLYELGKTGISQKATSPSSPESGQANQILGFEAVRTGPGCDVFSAVYQGHPVVVEIYKAKSNSVIEKSWDLFSRTIRRLNEGPESAVCQAPVLEQFWDWLQVQADIERKRMILGNLQKVPHSYVSRFPRLIADLQSPNWLVYEGMEGSPLDKELHPDSSNRNRSMQLLTEGILEQCLLLSLIDTEFLLESFLLLPDGSLGFRTLPAWVSVPVEWHYELLQYMVSTAVGNTPRALQMLSRMSSDRGSYAGEQHLLNQLSALQPELKVNAVTPESVVVLENYWRALAKSSPHSPFFLHLFHRNLTLLGQHNGSVDPARDAIIEALWPVLGRVVRFHLEEMLSAGRLREWSISSGLFFMTAARQMELALENLRDDNSAMTAALDHKDSDSRNAKVNRRIASLIGSAILLVVFLFSAQLALGAGGGPFPLFAKAAALAAAVALCISVASIR